MPVGSKIAVEKIFSAAGTRKEELWLRRRRVIFFLPIIGWPCFLHAFFRK